MKYMHASSKHRLLTPLILRRLTGPYSLPARSPRSCPCEELGGFKTLEILCFSLPAVIFDHMVCPVCVTSALVSVSPGLAAAIAGAVAVKKRQQVSNKLKAKQLRPEVSEQAAKTTKLPPTPKN
jgi:hypothetical protein